MFYQVNILHDQNVIWEGTFSDLASIAQKNYLFEGVILGYSKGKGVDIHSLKIEITPRKY